MAFGTLLWKGVILTSVPSYCMILQEPVPRLIANLMDFERRNIKLLLVVVTDKDSSSNARVETQLAELKKKASIPIELRFYNLSDLEKEFEINP